MRKVFCIRHAQYDGTTPPDLSCRTCCSTYIDHVTLMQAQLRERQGFNAYKWLTKKTARAEDIALAGGQTSKKGQ